MPKVLPPLRTIDDEDKGRPIRIRGGDYHGMTGWLNKNGYKTTSFTQVILFVRNGAQVFRGNSISVEKGYYVRVKHENIADPFGKAISYEEALVQQFVDIDKAMNVLARKFAAFGIDSNRPDLFDLLKEKTDYYCGKDIFLSKCRKVVYSGPDRPDLFLEELVDDIDDDM